jgi:hypothetical protein
MILFQRDIVHHIFEVLSLRFLALVHRFEEDRRKITARFCRQLIEVDFVASGAQGIDVGL